MNILRKAVKAFSLDLSHNELFVVNLVASGKLEKKMQKCVFKFLTKLFKNTCESVNF